MGTKVQIWKANLFTGAAHRIGVPHPFVSMQPRLACWISCSKRPVFTDFRWVAYHLNKKSAYRTCAFGPLNRKDAEGATESVMRSRLLRSCTSGSRMNDALTGKGIAGPDRVIAHGPGTGLRVGV